MSELCVDVFIIWSVVFDTCNDEFMQPQEIYIVGKIELYTTISFALSPYFYTVGWSQNLSSYDRRSRLCSCELEFII